MALPTPAEVAREMPAMVVETGGAIELIELDSRVKRMLRSHLRELNEGVGTRYLEQLFSDAVTIAIRQGLMNSSGSRLLLTERGWEQAALMKAEREKRGEREPDPELQQLSDEVIDTSGAEPIVDYERHDGTIIRGYLNEDFAAEINGSPMNMPASQLLERLYRAEVNGEESSYGLWTTLRQSGVSRNAVDFVVERCGVRLPSVRTVGGRRHQARSRTASTSLSRRRTRWPTLLCEVIHDLGGHAELPSVVAAVQQRPEAEACVGWREEVMQALRIHKVPSGRQYFDVAEVGGQKVFVLTENGHATVRRRFQDDRVPSLSKYLAKAIDEEDGGKRLTDMELYAMLFLATRLGRAKDAWTIYHRLPSGFPDEDSYAMIPLWIEQAGQMQDDG